MSPSADAEPDRPRVGDVITGVIDQRLSYLKRPALRDLVRAVRDLRDRGIDGHILECGTALGGSAIVLAAAKEPSRPMRVYDLFGMIPPPTEEDGADVAARYETIARGESSGIAGDVYYGYRDDLLADVSRAFRDFGLPVEANQVELVRGLFEDTVVVDFPVALAHLDGDWYESTMTCLQRIVPHLVVGGRLVIDDYKKWQGCRKAVDEYFADRTGFAFEMHQRLHIVRDR